MLDLADRHRSLFMLGVVRTVLDIDDDPYELCEVSAAICDALDAFDESRAAKPARIPKGFEGGGRFRKLSDTVFEALQNWANGDVDNPFEGVLSDDPVKRREQIRRVAKERGLTLRRGATFNEIANQVLDDFRKGNGEHHDAPDAKPKAPAKKATPRAPEAKPNDMLPGEGPVDYERRKKIEAISAGVETATSQAEALEYLKGRKTSDLRLLAREFGVDTRVPIPGAAQSRTPTPTSSRLATHDELAEFVLTAFVFDGYRKKWDENAAKRDATPDPEAAGRAEQARIDAARRYADVAGQLDEFTAHDARPEAVLARLDAAAQRHGITDEMAGVRAAVEEARQVEVENRIRAAYRVAIRGRRRPTTGTSHWVSLARLRTELGDDLPRAEVDRVLDRMIEQPDVRIQAELNQRLLTQADRDAAVAIGGESRDIISIDDPSDRPVPSPRAEMDRLLAAHGITRDGEAGQATRFDPKTHQSITGRGDLRAGQPVEVVRPGFTLTRDGQTVRLSKATVEAADEVRPKSAADRIADMRAMSTSEEGHAYLADASVAQLREMAGELKLSKSGDRASLRDRIVEGTIGFRETASVFDGMSHPDPAPDPEALRDSLDLKTVPELKAMLRERGLPVSGRKRELVDRLVGDGGGAGEVVGPPVSPSTAATRPLSEAQWGALDTVAMSPNLDESFLRRPGFKQAERDGQIAVQDGRLVLTDQGRADHATRRPVFFDPDATAERVLGHEDADAMIEALADLNAAQLRRVATALNISAPRTYDRNGTVIDVKSMTALEWREYIVERIQYDRKFLDSVLTRDERTRQLVATGMTWKEAREQVKREARSDDMDAEARSRVLALAEVRYTDFLRAAGHDVTPGHDELHHYWTRGEGRAKWVHSPKPWTTLVALLTRHVGPEKAKVFASRWFHEVFGFYAGSDLNRVTHGKPPRGHRVGPG